MYFLKNRASGFVSFGITVKICLLLFLKLLVLRVEFEVVKTDLFQIVFGKIFLV